MATFNLTYSPAVAMLAEDDLERARAFWRDTIGLAEIYANEEYQEVAFQAGGTVFALYAHRGGSRADHTQLAFQVEDVGRSVEGLRNMGVSFEDYDLPGLRTMDGIADMGDGGQGAWFKDPGGNIIGLFTASERLTRAMERGAQMVGASPTR